MTTPFWSLFRPHIISEFSARTALVLLAASIRTTCALYPGAVERGQPFERMMQNSDHQLCAFRVLKDRLNLRLADNKLLFIIDHTILVLVSSTHYRRIQCKDGYCASARLHSHNMRVSRTVRGQVSRDGRRERLERL